MPSFSNTLTLTLIVLMSQINIVFRNENPDTFAPSIALRTHYVLEHSQISQLVDAR